MCFELRLRDNTIGKLAKMDAKLRAAGRCAKLLQSPQRQGNITELLLSPDLVSIDITPIDGGNDSFTVEKSIGRVCLTITLTLAM